jgi:DNA repair exonuclease SbcCD ATPase subunit
MDLFNPPPNFNYNYMKHELDVSTLNNPYIRVIWEDFAENFTQEKIKSVKHYFEKKYNTNNVGVITKTKTVDNSNQTVDISFNILDKNYQLELVKSYLSSKTNENYLDKIIELDSKVDNKLLIESSEVTPFKRWFIKNIEFSNFLSYGQKQKIDFEKCSGITVVESNPPNFGGKTVLTVDLLLFLFFNETTKSSKAEEIFNRFTTVDKVNVKGEIIIDGDEYVIVRNIERKKSKSGEWNVKTELDFFKKLSDGSLQNFTGEQRRETENFIKSSIGSKEDFLMTILTTATNLEDLIDAKPTARGLVLSRFMGLEFLKKKEDTAKEIFGEFSKSMMSNVYNSETLKNDNLKYGETITSLNELITSHQGDLVKVQERIINGQKYRDSLLNKKHSDLDKEITLLQPSKLESDIETLTHNKEKVQNQLDNIKVVEPSSFYHEDKHDKIKEDITKSLTSKVELETKIKEIEKLKTSVEGGIKCEHCGIELLNASITQSKINELAGLITQKTEIESIMTDLLGKEKELIDLKKQFDEYEKNKLIKEKLESDIESHDLKIKNIQDKLTKYNQVQDKISENNKIDSQVIKADLLLDNLEIEKNKINKNINDNTFQIKSLKEKIDTNKKILVKISEEFEIEKIYKLYLEIYGKNGISKMMMKTMMPIINSELQRLLEDSSHFKLEVRINDKNEVEFIMIDNNSQVEKLMSTGSGYERTIASLALRAVLSKICSLPRADVIVFDEVFGKISNENLDMVFEFFTKIKEYFEKIFVITHNPLVTNWADNVVKIKKENNISFVEQ